MKKLPERAESLMETFILNDYETLKQKPKQEVYIAFERQAVVKPRGNGDQHYCSSPRTSIAVRPLALGAIRASSICPG